VNRQYSALSGIAIALIILNHTIHFGVQVAPVAAEWLWLTRSMQALGTFAVPTFLFISGAFLAYSFSQISLRFLRASLSRILWPYAVWSVLFYLFLSVVSREHHSWSWYATSLLVGYPYHFVPLLLFWYVSALGLVKMVRRHPILLIATVGVYQALLIAIRYPGLFGPTLPTWTSLMAPPVLAATLSEWAVYFPLGVALTLHNGQIRAQLEQLKWSAVATAGALFVLGNLDAAGTVYAPWARFVAPVPLMFALPVMVRESIPMRHWFEALGKETYGLYLSHFVVITVVVSLSQMYGPGLDHPLMVLPGFGLIALAVPLLLMRNCARIAPLRPAYRYLFGSTPPVYRAATIRAHLVLAESLAPRPTVTGPPGRGSQAT
jgi:fucose 4-O-acetylase-like acetyltransferase